MDCKFCGGVVEQFDKPTIAHIVIVKDVFGHVHVHGDLGDADEVRELVTTAYKEIAKQSPPEDTTVDSSKVTTKKPELIEGRTYTDAKGEKAVYRNGKFEPVQ